MCGTTEAACGVELWSRPDTYKFITDTPKNITAMYKVIGNAVPVNLANAIAEAIMEQVFKEK